MNGKNTSEVKLSIFPDDLMIAPLIKYETEHQ
jgi:hypothetical protein